MGIKNVDGSNDKNSVMLYTLSTCVWCKRTKMLLEELKVKYDYIDVDMLSGEEQDKVLKDIEAVNPKGGFPTMVINETTVIIGFKPEEIKEKLG